MSIFVRREIRIAVDHVALVWWSHAHAIVGARKVA
jgi:hypothetical protein